jgi:hypothetical protein
MYQFTPEALYAETVARKRAYADLSHTYAAAGNAFAAVHAAFAADAQTIQVVMWERVMVASPNPDEKFREVADTVANALAAYAANPTPAATAREAVEGARAAMLRAFSVAAADMISEYLLPLDHLDTLPFPDPAVGAHTVQTRTGGEHPEKVAKTRLRAAHDCMVMAVALNSEGRLDEAMQQAWASDWATLEAYLLEAALRVGDYALMTVEMRWLLASEAVAQIEALPTDFNRAVAVVRERMVAALGAVEGDRLNRMFEPLA